MSDILDKFFGSEELQLSDEIKTQLTEAIDLHTQETLKTSPLVEEKVQLALEAMDTEHAEGIKILHERFTEELHKQKSQLDEEVANKVQRAFEVVEEDRIQKIIALQEKHEKTMLESVKTTLNATLEAMDKYFDNFLDKHVPTEFLEEAARKDYSEELIGKIGNLVGANSIDPDIREALQDAKAQIDHLQEQNESFKKAQFFAENTQNLPAEQVKFLTESFKDKDMEFVERNFEFLNTQFKNNQEKEILQEKRTIQKPATKPNVNHQLIAESNQQGGQKTVDDAMAFYLTHF